MKPATRTAPDLENGFLVLGTASANAWTTEVLCAVTENSASRERRHYLSKECRAEDVPFADGAASGTIFQVERSWEFVMAIVDGRAIQLTNSDIAVLPELSGDATGTAEHALVQPVGMTEEFTTEVHCGERAMRIVPVVEALERLRDRRLPVRDLFMRVTWSSTDGENTLYCPCRYVNFGTQPGSANDYVQPISGYAMVPASENGLQIGYVACALAADGRAIIEFCGKRYLNVFLWAARRIESEGGSAEAARALAHSFPISATVFDRIMAIDGSCDLYEYA